MTLMKAIATNGDVHVLRDRVSIAIFQHEEDADLFIQAAETKKAPRREGEADGWFKLGNKWVRRDPMPIPQFDHGSISHPRCLACRQPHPVGMPCPDMMVMS